MFIVDYRVCSPNVVLCLLAFELRRSSELIAVDFLERAVRLLRLDIAIVTMLPFDRLIHRSIALS
jgi:hypothetical protein